MHTLPDHQAHRKPFPWRQEHEKVETGHDDDEEGEHALQEGKRFDRFLVLDIAEPHDHRDDRRRDVNVWKEAYSEFRQELRVRNGLKKRIDVPLKKAVMKSRVKAFPSPDRTSKIDKNPRLRLIITLTAVCIGTGSPEWLFSSYPS